MEYLYTTRGEEPLDVAGSDAARHRCRCASGRNDHLINRVVDWHTTQIYKRTGTSPQNQTAVYLTG